MDMTKFYDRLLNDETIADIPINFVFRIVLSVLGIINSGECYYKDDIE